MWAEGRGLFVVAGGPKYSGIYALGAVRYPGIKIHEPRVIRLLEVLLHGGSHLGGWTAKQIHHAALTNLRLRNSAYGPRAT